MRVAIFELSGLVSGGGHPGISQQLVRGVKSGEVADFGQDHGCHTEAQPWDSGNRRMKLIHNGLDLFFNFSNFMIQFADEPDGVLQFKRLGRHPGANRVSGGISDFKSHVPFVVAFRGSFEQCFQPRQMSCGNLFGTGEFLQQGVDRSNMQRRNELFQLWKQDADQSSDRTFQLGTLFHLVKTVSGQ